MTSLVGRGSLRWRCSTSELDPPKLRQALKLPDQSAMPYFDKVLTVTDLTDLVEFLQLQCTLLQPKFHAWVIDPTHGDFCQLG